MTRKAAKVKATAAEPCSPFFLFIFLHSGRFAATSPTQPPEATTSSARSCLLTARALVPYRVRREETSYTSAPDFQALRRLVRSEERRVGKECSAGGAQGR